MDRTANLLGALALLVSDAVSTETSRPAGRSGAAAAALAVLLQEPGLGIEALRRPLGLTQSATVRVVNGLVADGLAVRTPGRDGRSVAVRLTPEGEAAGRKVLAARAAVLDRIARALDDAERATLTRLLEKALAAGTGGRAHAELVCRLCDLEACPQDVCPVDLASRATPEPTA